MGERARGPALLACLALLALSAWLTRASLFRQDVHVDSRLTGAIPSRLGSWALVEEHPPTPSEIRGLETSDIVKRTYADGRDRVELVVAHIARSSRKSAHAQEACLRGAGAMVGSVELARLRRVPVEAKILTLDMHDRRQWVYYWYKMGEVHTGEYLLSSLKMFLRGLAGGPGPRGTSLVRLLTVERRGETPAEVSARLEDFAFHLLPELNRRLP